MNNNRNGRLHVNMIGVAAGISLAFALATACTKPEPAAEKAGAHAGMHAEKEQKAERRENRVELTPEAAKTAGIEVYHVVTVAPSDLIGATAVVELNGDRVSRVNPRVSGRCVDVNVSLGDRVHAGQTIARIDALEVDQAWSDYLKARASLELATKSVKREETLFQKKISPEKDLLRAREELSRSEADMLLAREKFRLLGIDADQVEANTSGTKHNHPLVPVQSPLAGVVVERSVTRGEMVSPEKTLFTIADLSTLWLMIDIYERDIGRIKSGMQVTLKVATYPGREFRGRISYIGDLLEEKSRTAKARVTIDNKEGLLKPGMFAATSIDYAGQTDQKAIVVPEEAVFRDGSQKYVFVRETDGTFKARDVLTGGVSGEKIEIKEGLKAGDVIVVKGVFALKSELKKTTLP